MTIRFKDPHAPATEKQYYKIRKLTGQDMSETSLTMREASDIIQQYEVSERVSQQIPQDAEPFSEAKVTIINGDQGSGKSATAVGRVVDAWYNSCIEIYCKNVAKIDCEVKGYDRQTRLAKIKHENHIKLLKIPQSYKLHSPMKIFANFHLYGIPSVYCSDFGIILKWLKEGVIRDGWLLIDEYYIGGKRP